VRFGRQRPASDVAALALLLVGFFGLAVAIFYLRETLLGLLVPLTFLVGVIAGLRAEVREVELLEDRLILRTFFRAYRIPRAHIRAVVLTPKGVAIDVQTGARFFINPPDVDEEPLLLAMSEWLRRNAAVPAAGPAASSPPV
jgi:hypothetical protein